MALEERICLGCGFSFLPRRSSQKSCSIECRNAVTARVSAELRADKMRGRTTTGAGRYRKRMGRPEHHVMAEVLLGRSLRAGEVVHHMDGDKSNNSPYNLIVMSSQSAHNRLGHDGHKARLKRGDKLAGER